MYEYRSTRWTTNTTTMRERGRRASPQQTTASCRWTRVHTQRPRKAAHPARVFRGYVSYESTAALAAVGNRAGLGYLIEKTTT